ncbi:filamentous hemagglutinin, partial [Pseudoxanthomonas broegbernensis]
MLVAGRDVNLTSVGETHAVDQTTVTQKKKLLSTKTTTTRDRVEDTWAIGTTLSGQTVQVAAGRDLNTEAAQIAGTGDVLL